MNDAAAAICGRLAQPDAMGEQSHTTSEEVRVHEGYRITRRLLRVANYAQVTEQKQVEKHT